MIEYLQFGYLRLVRLTWHALPMFATIALMMIANAPLNLLQDQVSAPDVALISVYFWAMHGPAFMQPWAVFFVGIAQDFAIGTPLGFWVLVYLLAYGFTLSQRVFFKGRTGIGVWLGFALVALIVSVFVWVASMLLQERWLAPWDAAGRGLMSIIVYPVLSRVFMVLRRSLTNAPETL